MHHGKVRSTSVLGLQSSVNLVKTGFRKAVQAVLLKCRVLKSRITIKDIEIYMIWNEYRIFNLRAFFQIGKEAAS